jgi:drug/metabolite transporter, DME family
MLLFLLLTRGIKDLRVAPRDLLFLIPQGIAGIGAFYLFYFFTVRESTVGTAAILLYSSPAFVVLLAWLFLKESLSLSRLVALVFTFGGILMVVGAYDLTALEVRPVVLATGLLSGLTYGLYSMFGKPLTGHLSPATILSYALGIGALLLFVAALPTLDTLVGLSPISYALLFMLAVVHTSLAFGLYTEGLKRLEAGQAAIVATVEPVVAGAVGIILLSEELSALKLFGALLVLAGAMLTQIENASPEKPPRSR